MIVDTLSQKTRFMRGAAVTEGTDQVIATNIDNVFIVKASGYDLSVRQVIVINKSDLFKDPVSSGISVIPVCAISGKGIGQHDRSYRLIRCRQVYPDQIAAGGQVQDTTDTRDFYGKGLTTTTVRQLFVLRSGALMIDNHGFQEVGIDTVWSIIDDTLP
ncbi:MAG: hypothetical protein WCF90_10365 [Methanomicrobiales archaeon]